MIKILFIVPRAGSINRGVEKFVFDLIQHLDKSRFTISIIGHINSLDKAVNFYEAAIMKREQFFWLDRIPLLFKRILFLFNLGTPEDIEAFSLYRWSKKNIHQRFDIAIPLGGHWSYVLSRYLAKKTISIGQSGVVYNWLKMSDAFVALTDYEYELSKNFSTKIKSVLIPNGIDVDRFKLEDTENNTILCVAALVNDKRLYLILEAFLLLPENTELKIIGSGPLKKQLENHKAFKTGRVSIESATFLEMPEKYNEAKIFTLPSKNEAFGIVFIEAMCSGLPIVAHDGPRQRFVLNKFAIFCNTEDPQEYANHLQQALSKNKSSNSHIYCQENYSWKIISTRYEELFQNIFDERNSKDF